MKDLVAVVTGGTRGIGLGIAESLARRGASVAITFRQDQGAAEKAKIKIKACLKKDRKIMLLQGDTADAGVVAEQYQSITESLGPVNVLVNNAGIMTRRSFEEITEADWQATLQTNLSGAFYWCAKVIPGMKKAKFGRIVNISSLAARGGGVVGPHYAASKAGLLGLTRYTARELGPFGVTVNAIAPAFIRDAGIFADWDRAQLDSLKDLVVLPQIGNVRDVVRAFEYLLDSPFVTGVALDVCGGGFMI